jgi:spermidine/putrescine transport system ATP-binding protein
MNNRECAIKVKGVSKVFGRGVSAFYALNNVTLDIFDNEFFTLLGPSGCGKTTLLRLIAGFDAQTEGDVLLHGKDISHLPPNLRSVNTVFQNYALFPHLTVAENIAFGLEMLNQPKAKIKATVEEMLALVHLTQFKHRRTNELSGGQKQRVALARALAPKPEVLLLDESLSALDYKLRKEMQIELKHLQSATGITFIFVTHDQEEALTMSDRIAVLSNGVLQQVGSPHEIYNRPANKFVASFVGDSNVMNLSEFDVNKNGKGIVMQYNGGKSFQIDVDESEFCATDVLLIVRPEKAFLTVGIGDAVLKGEIHDISFLGTDTHFRINLSTGKNSPKVFVVRTQNVGYGGCLFSVGDHVGIDFHPQAAQLLLERAS